MKTIVLLLVFAVLLVLAVKQPNQTLVEATRDVVSAARTAGSVLGSTIESLRPLAGDGERNGDASADGAGSPQHEHAAASRPVTLAPVVAPDEAVHGLTTETVAPPPAPTEPGALANSGRSTEALELPEFLPRSPDASAAADESSYDLVEPQPSIEALYGEARRLLDDIE